MTTIVQERPAEKPVAAPAVHEELDYLRCQRGLRSWLTTLDHKRIGILYLISIVAAFVLGGLMAVAIRVELFAPGEQIVGEDTYNNLFTLHGAIMVFLFVIPSIPAVIGNFVLPLMLGAKDVAFPRLNLASWYLWVFGAIFFVVSMVTGGLDTGWTFYPPYSTTTGSSVLMAALGAFILGFSSIATGINFIVTIQKMRPAGMGWFQMPLMLWSLYATAIIQVLATPVLGITVLLLAAERLVGIGFFDPTMDGDPLLFQHFFWFYSHPAVYIMILPAMGVMSELVSTFSRKRPFGYAAIAYSSIAIALFGFLVWGHHMFTSQSALAGAVFSALTFSVSIPSAIKVFNWLATMYKGSISLATPMCYALSFFALFAIGGLTGIVLGALSTNVKFHDTYFVVAHFHYVMMGGTFILFVGALYYYWPKIFGRMVSEKWGKIGCFGVFVCFNLTFFPQFVLGSQGMPRRYFDYDPQFVIYHQVSTVGAFVLGIFLLIVLLNLIHGATRGRPAPKNPWGSPGLEWRTASPPVHHNFVGRVSTSDPYDYERVEWDPEIGGYVDREDSEPRVVAPTAGAGTS